MKTALYSFLFGGLINFFSSWYKLTSTEEYRQNSQVGPLVAASLVLGILVIWSFVDNARTKESAGTLMMGLVIDFLIAIVVFGVFGFIADKLAAALLVLTTLSIWLLEFVSFFSVIVLAWIWGIRPLLWHGINRMRTTPTVNEPPAESAPRARRIRRSDQSNNSPAQA